MVSIMIYIHVYAISYFYFRYWILPVNWLLLADLGILSVLFPRRTQCPLNLCQIFPSIVQGSRRNSKPQVKYIEYTTGRGSSVKERSLRDQDAVSFRPARQT